MKAREFPNAPIAAKVWGLSGVKGQGDAEIARLAELQRGLVHRSQLIAARISREAISHRLHTRRLHPQSARYDRNPRLFSAPAAPAAVSGLGPNAGRTAFAPGRIASKNE